MQTACFGCFLVGKWWRGWWHRRWRGWEVKHPVCYQVCLHQL